jgi:hypothetical protein
MSSDRDRQRLHRAREREGRAIMPVAVNMYELADALVLAGFIQAWDCDNRDRIRDGLQRMVDTLVAASSRVTD